MKLFKIISKVIKVIYKLNLLLKIKIHLVYYIAMLKPVYRDAKPLLYKEETYKRKEENKWKIQKVVNYQEGDNCYRLRDIGIKVTKVKP